ncbi:RnfH family protein [Xylophilus sp. GW821-FHT01B05]
MAIAEPLQITVAIAQPDATVRELALQLPAGSTLGQALLAAGLSVDEATDAGIWGRARPLDAPLRDGDRAELYRPLRVDPKVARRERFRQQGARTTGLFARQREGSKSGY